MASSSSPAQTSWNYPTKYFVSMVADRMVNPAYDNIKGYAHARGIAEFNAKVHLFNGGTALLAAGVAMAILMNFTAAVVFGSAGYFIRYTAEREISFMEAPDILDLDSYKGGEKETLRDTLARVNYLVSQVRGIPSEEAGKNILRHLDIEPNKEDPWDPYQQVLNLRILRTPAPANVPRLLEEMGVASGGGGGESSFWNKIVGMVTPKKR